MGRKRTEEFRADAVRIALSTQPGNERADTQAGRFRFGCGLSGPNKWVTAHRDTDVVTDRELDLARKNQRLRRENRILEDERDIPQKGRHRLRH